MNRKTEKFTGETLISSYGERIMRIQQSETFFPTRGQLYFVLYDGSNHEAHTTPLLNNTWYHIVATYDNAHGISMYVNGALTDNDSFSGTPNAKANTNMIGAKDSNQFFNGSIDEVARWHDTDQSANVSAIYNGGTPTDLNTLPTQPTNWWRMGDNATWDGFTWTLASQGIDTVTNLRSRNMEIGDRQTDVP